MKYSSYYSQENSDVTSPVHAKNRFDTLMKDMLSICDNIDSKRESSAQHKIHTLSDMLDATVVYRRHLYEIRKCFGTTDVLQAEIDRVDKALALFKSSASSLYSQFSTTFSDEEHWDYGMVEDDV